MYLSFFKLFNKISFLLHFYDILIYVKIHSHLRLKRIPFIMNIYHLRYFVTLAHYEHYTKAAAKLNTTQPNLSYAISSLESELGVSLFEKEGRNVVLTKCGKDFLADVEHCLSILDSSIHKMHLLSCGDGLIEIGFLRTLGVDYIPQILAQYQQSISDKNVTFNFRSGVTADLITMLKDKLCDIVFCSYKDNEPDIDFIPIATQDLVLIVPNNHPLAQKSEIDLVETLPYPQIFFDRRSGLRSIVDNMFQKINSTPNIALEIEEDQVIAGFVAAGFGVAIVPDMPTLNQLPLKSISIHNPSWERRFYMAYLKNQYQTPVINDFIRFIKNNSLFCD